MGLIKSLKGKAHNGTDTLDSHDAERSSTGGNPETESTGRDQYSTGDDNRRGLGDYDHHDHPPPSSTFTPTNPSSRSNPSEEIYNPPPGPPPPPSHSRRQNNESYEPPSGPPPSHHHHDEADNAEEQFLPPSGPPPPPNKPENPPPYHDWTVIPDTALLPPPPAIPQDSSPTNNASYDSAAAAHAWCARNPLYTPTRPSDGIYQAVQRGDITLDLPPPAPVPRQRGLRQHQPKPLTINQINQGRYRCQSHRSHPDTILMSTLPLFFAAADNPSHNQKQIYFEIHIHSLSDPSSGLAVGFAAKPYPLWRLPGWHRASLAVHGDDGRRFVNDSWGGRDFVAAFKKGDTVGMGMVFTSTGDEMNKVKAFFTRNGRIEGEWDVNEERDAERDEGGVEGLLGDKDLYAAVGVFGATEFEVLLRKGDWMFRG